ncbi:oxidative damage protection protein [Candidatus Riesia pediculischaeffi]|uniref:Iron transporter n=1 Tax=Candidatus Riesia pediculischaeffi TaxID=428411 RepID=A0A1V0HKV5_9ENTR|nr:oxidative damage protection protein [Candidatus Riesia pediculischaeffi]ARC53487.1 iron transporter [Candidatus Riesia pediculischaeffi]
MSKIYCRFFKKELTQLDSQPFPGKLGERVLKEISKEAWNLWMVRQTNLINENRMDTSSIKDRMVIMQEMKNFLFSDQSGKSHIPF